MQNIPTPQPLHNSANSSSSTATLAHRYRTACFEDLSLALTFLRHPVAGRSKHVSRLDHSISLPDGYVATVRTRRVRLPSSLAMQLKEIQPELEQFPPAQLFLSGVVVRIAAPKPMIVSADEIRTPSGQAHSSPAKAGSATYDYPRSRAVAEAMHHPHHRRWVHENGSDNVFGGFRFAWVGTYDAKPLPSPRELFVPRAHAA